MKFIKNFTNFLKNIFKRKKINGNETESVDAALSGKTDSLKARKPAVPSIKQMIVVIGFCIVMLMGMIVGILIINNTKTPLIYTVPATTVEAKPERNIYPAFNALDPVSGDWGIDIAELQNRINLTLDKTGARNSIIKNFSQLPDNEFRHNFSSSLHIIGETAPNGNISRVAIFCDPVYSPAEYQSALALIRAIINAIEPSFTREEIIAIDTELGLSQQAGTPDERRAEYKHKNFIFKVWSVAGRAFVFTASSM